MTALTRNGLDSVNTTQHLLFFFGTEGHVDHAKCKIVLELQITNQIQIALFQNKLNNRFFCSWRFCSFLVQGNVKGNGISSYLPNRPI